MYLFRCMANVQILKQKFQCPCDVIPVWNPAFMLYSTQSNFLDPRRLCCIAPYAVVIYDKFM
ncbi:hypothetical protein [Wolbachia endosymbiont (group A) of Agelastica alni]|uniref:hypothetical protein n=1 Tax=Wolbachia endosymbiont (group A) of Agelastica alni TaxID=3066130 RepID=UPI003342918C